jgi:hypothetical protein
MRVSTKLFRPAGRAPAAPLRAGAIATSIAVLAGILSFAAPAFIAPQSAAAAADLSAFDPGLIITDDIFYNSTTMSSSQVQSFFTSHDPSCNTHSSGGTQYTCLADYRATTKSRGSSPECRAYTGRSNESAAAIVARVAAVCDINPQVILVTLQKEQGFIDGGARSSAIYRKAMGYGCPDTANCDTKYYGFFNQVYSAAWQFQHYRLNPTHYSIRAGRVNAISYSPSAGCGHANVYVRSQATAGLYTYTPYTPNAAAIQAGTGAGNGCSSYGNRNFFYYFSRWFGNPADMLKSAGFESGLSTWASGSTGTVSHTVRSSSTQSQSGTHYLAVSNQNHAGRSIGQTISRRGVNGGMYLAGVWVKSDKPGVPFSGVLRASASGGTALSVETPFVAGDSWTWVQTQLSVTHTGITSFHFSVILNTKGSSLDLDGGLYYLDSEQQPTTAVSIHSASFENSLSGWTKNGPSAVTDAVKRTSSAQQGSYLLTAKATKAEQSVRQAVSLSPRVDDSYVFGAWVKASSTGTGSYTGRLRLASSGGTQDSSFTTFTVDSSTWKYVTTTLDIVNPGHSALTMDIRLDTLGQTLLVDNVTLTPNLMPGGSFEGTTGGLTARTGTASVAIVDGTALGVTPIDNQRMLEMSTTGGLASSVSLGDRRTIAANDSYTATVRVRSASPGKPVTGRLRLWGVGGTAPDSFNEVPFTTTDNWTAITVKHAMGADRTGIRVEFMIDSTDTNALLLDRLQVR